MQGTAQHAPAGWSLPRCDLAVLVTSAFLIRSNSLDPSASCAALRFNDCPRAFHVMCRRVYADVRRDTPSDSFSPRDGTALQNSGSMTMTVDQFASHASVARRSEGQPKGGIASLSSADRAAVAARAAAALMQRANAACDIPMASRVMPRPKEAAGGAQHDWAPADWMAESMADTVDSFCLDSAMGPMDNDGYDFQSGNEVSGFGAGWLSGDGSYAHGSAPITAVDFGDVGGGFASPFEAGSLHGDAFAVPDVAAAGPPDHAHGGLPTSFLSDTRFPMLVTPDLPLAYGGLPAAPAAPPGSAALRSNSCSDPAHVPSLMVVNVPVGSHGGSDAAADEPASDGGTGSPDGRSQRLAARAERAARRAAADGDGGHAAEDGAVRDQLAPS